MMLTLLPGYQIDSLIQESSHSFLYRGHRDIDAQPVLLKVLKPDYCTPVEIARYQREYSILKSLEIDGSLQAHKLEKYQNTLILILENFSGNPLSQWMKERRATLEEFLKLAIQISEILGCIHEASIIHQNLNPHNILFDRPSGKVKICDFGMALEMSRDYPLVSTTRSWEENLAYISPEQTGRMNCSLDHRTDFYSLGVTFYELLVGHLPFDCLDPMELIHAHIALTPKSPHQIDSTIPKAVSDIVMKMLAKTAEERYQSAWGIESDLVLCLMQLEATGLIEDLIPGENDIIRNFQVSQKFYGREKEKSQLLAAGDRLLSRTQVPAGRDDTSQEGRLSVLKSSNGNRNELEIFILKGEPGIGKSLLVAEIKKKLAAKHVYAIDIRGQRSPNTSCSSIEWFLQAIRDFIKQLLAESEARLSDWKYRFIDAIGNRRKLAIDIIPELQLILEDADSLDLGISDRSANEDRRLLLQDIIFCICNTPYPIVIILDDLQWIDPELLEIIEKLIDRNKVQNLLIIGTYRTKNPETSNELESPIKRIKNRGISVNSLSLGPLELTSISHLLADTLHTDLKSVRELSQLVLQKTQGNPREIHKFLQKTHADRKILFDNSSLSWQWDIKKLEEIEVSDNVVLSTLDHITRLPRETQTVLELASCMGLCFDLRVLSQLCQNSQSEVLSHLKTALKLKIIKPKKVEKWVRSAPHQEHANSYEFTDAKILNSINNRLNESEKKKIRLEIAKILITNISNFKSVEVNRLFSIADHFNYSVTLVNDLEEKLKIAEIDLEAARRAKALMKHDLARSYTSAGISIVPEEIWTAKPELAFALHKERAEIEYLNGNCEGSRILVEHLTDRAPSPLEKAEFENILIPQYTLVSKYEMAIEIGKNALHFLEFDFGDTENLEIQLLQKLSQIQTQLSQVQIESLKARKALSDAKLKMVMKVLRNLEVPTACIDRTLFVWTIANAIDLSMSEGHVPESATAYAGYGMVQTAIFDNPHFGYELAALGIELSENMKAIAHKCQACMRQGAQIAPWTKSLKTSISILDEGIRAGSEANEFQFTAYSLAYKILLIFYSGKNLKDILFEIVQLLDFCTKHKNYWSIDLIKSVQLPILNLCDKLFVQVNSKTDAYCESEYLKTCHSRNSQAALCCYYIHQAQVHYLYNEYDLSLQFSRQAEPLLDSIWSTFSVVEHQFYYALSLAALYPSVSPEEQTKSWQILEAIQAQMMRWTDNCPSNFQDRYLLVSAEMAKISGRELEAIDLYDRAIECAREREWVYGEALANERAAILWLHRGNHKIAKVYLQDAHRGYQLWGAVRKVEKLEQQYAYLLLDPAAIADLIPSANCTLASDAFATLSGSRSGVLDLATVTKAAQVLSGEIEIGQLLDKLMQMAIANAGATSGFLILSREEGLTIEAAKMAGSDEINVRQSTPVDESDRLPLSIVTYVARTHESIVATDAIYESAFASDPYIQSAKPKSILCAPIQGQGKLIGIVYLENNLAVGAFTRDRLDVLMLLCAQGAIALENARLYENLQTSEMREREKAQQLEQSLQDLQEAQLKLIQGEKMATLGQLVSGVAHEINNPVGFIAANISHAKGYFEDLMSLLALYQEIYPDADPRIIEEIETIDLEFLQEDLPKILSSMDVGIDRIRQISKSLRTFSRNDEAAKVAVNLHDGIDSTLMILKHRMKANNERPAIEVIRDYGTLPEIQCFAGPLNQVFMNLLANAIDALEESNLGRTYADLEKNPNTIRITTEFDEPRQVAIVKISDNGPGMTAEIQQKVFDHLFTTKPVGKGTGLGLSISRQIVVEKHGGQLSCHSTLGEGTTFMIEIPVA
ncbi:MAG TPA: protein kinase [Oscillatoriales cyanobacterium M59_W2019_021]|nr:protein kinase [Oscillatoriales cyanobacterium M59_W2019_021]